MLDEWASCAEHGDGLAMFIGVLRRGHFTRLRPMADTTAALLAVGRWWMRHPEMSVGATRFFVRGHAAVLALDAKRR